MRSKILNEVDPTVYATPKGKGRKDKKEKIHGNCDYCGKPFVTSYKVRRFCNDVCGRYYHYRTKSKSDEKPEKKKGMNWTKLLADIHKLTVKLGRYPTHVEIAEGTEMELRLVKSRCTFLKRKGYISWGSQRQIWVTDFGKKEVKKYERNESKAPAK